MTKTFAAKTKTMNVHYLTRLLKKPVLIKRTESNRATVLPVGVFFLRKPAAVNSGEIWRVARPLRRDDVAGSSGAGGEAGE